MPFKSKAQQRFMYSQHPDIAKRWEDETPNIKKLPARVKSKKPRVRSKSKLSPRLGG